MEQRKHPVCVVKGCDRLQSRKVTVSSPEYGSFDVRLCEKHAKNFDEAKDMHISMGAGVRDCRICGKPWYECEGHLA